MKYYAEVYICGLKIDFLKTDKRKDITYLFKKYGESSAIRVWIDGVKLSYMESDKMFLAPLLRSGKTKRGF